MARFLHTFIVVFAAMYVFEPTRATPDASAIVVVLQDLTEHDLMAIQSKTNSADVIDRLRSHLPNSVPMYRSSSPDTTPALASILTGQFPSELGIYDSNQAKPLGGSSDPNMLSTFKTNGANVGFFGVWPFEDSLDALTTSSFETKVYETVIEKAIDFIEDTTQADDKPFLLVVSLPRIDAAFNFGGTFDEVSWNPGVEGPREERWSTCPDVKRGESRYVARYKTCPKQIYRANRIHELRGVVRLLDAASRTIRKNHLVLFTSTNGGESELVDGHSKASFGFRGEKRSLYDGGIVVPLWYEWHTSGPQRRSKFRLHRRRSWPRQLSSSGMASVDLFPTLLDIVGILPNSISDYPSIDGISAATCMALKRSCDKLLDRQKPLKWEWRASVPGHCLNEAPRYSILVRDFKLLYEPAVPFQDQVMDRVELYDLTRGNFELVNLSNHSFQDPINQANMASILQRMKDLLQNWIEKLHSLDPTSTLATPHLGCRRGLPTLNSPLNGTIPNDRPTLSQAYRRENLQGIVFILADDMPLGDISGYDGFNADHSSLYNVDVKLQPDTPTFDKLMQEGLTLTSFYSDGPACSPSRASIMTGRRPSHRQVAFHNALDRKSQANKRRGVASYLGHADPSISTVPRFFSENGFVTAHFGKWHLSYSSPERFSPTGSFYKIDEYQLYGDKSFDKGSVKFPTASRAHPTFWNNKDLLFPSYAQEAIVNRTLAFLRDRRDDGKRFFANVWIQNPHAPLNLATEYDQPAENGLPSSENPWPNRNPGAALNPGVDENIPHQIYRVLLRDHERSIARLVGEIDRMGLAEKTVLIHTSDNGPEDRAMYFTMAGNAGPFRGGKRSLYDGGIRMPFLALWKNHIPAGRVLTIPTSNVDLFPTLAGLAGLEDKFKALKDANWMQGKDMSCAWLGSCESCNGDAACDQDSLGEGQRTLFWEYRDVFLGDCLGLSARFAVRKGQYKLHWEPKRVTDLFPNHRTGTERMELYDLHASAFEAENLLESRPNDSMIRRIAQELHTDLLKYVQSNAYDRKYKPVRSFLQLRRDYTRTPFLREEMCPFNRKALRGARSTLASFAQMRAVGLLPADPCPSGRNRRQCHRGDFLRGICHWQRRRCTLKRNQQGKFSE